MTRHVHFDLEQMRADYMAANANAVASARATAETPAAQRGIDLQERFMTLMVEATIIACQARNDGFDEHSIGKALGHVLGNTSGNFMANALAHGRPDAAMTHHETMLNMVEASALGAEKIDGMTTTTVRHRAMQGSRA